MPTGRPTAIERAVPAIDKEHGQAAQATGSSPSRPLRNVAVSLQIKATFLVILVTVVVIGATSGWVLKSAVDLLQGQRNDGLRQTAAIMARLIAPAVVAADTETLQSVAEDAVNAGAVAFIVILDRDGRELAWASHIRAAGATDRIRNGPLPPAGSGSPAQHPAQHEIPAHVELNYPLTIPAVGAPGAGPRGTNLVGYIRTGLISELWEHRMARMSDLLVGVGIIATVIAVPLAFLVVRRIIAPLETLEGVILRFSRGDWNVRSKVGRLDEIGRLALSFNRMADLQQQAHERLFRMNMDLEARVAKRTQQLRELAAREPLTGLYNRRHLNEMLDRCFAEASRYQHELSCLMLDLDDFKIVNDTCGHHVGDELLILTGAVIAGELRSSDIAARYGGDEFIILLPQTDAERAEVLAERIIEKLIAEVHRRAPQAGVSMSIGVASLRKCGAQTADDLIRAADRSMYHAKKTGKNRVVVAAPPATQPA